MAAQAEVLETSISLCLEALDEAVFVLRIRDVVEAVAADLLRGDPSSGRASAHRLLLASIPRSQSI